MLTKFQIRPRGGKIPALSQNVAVTELSLYAEIVCIFQQVSDFLICPIYPLTIARDIVRGVWSSITGLPARVILASIKIT